MSLETNPAQETVDERRRVAEAQAPSNAPPYCVVLTPSGKSGPNWRVESPVKSEDRVMQTKIRFMGFSAVAALLAMSVPGVCTAEEVIWHIKAVHPEGRLLNVKALDESGKIYPVKAIEQHGNRHLMDVKALIDGKRLPVKILVSDDKLAPVKAIGEDGTIFDIKALTSDGRKLDVKGVRRTGSIIDIKAIGPGGQFYGVKAMSPRGHLYDVKGVKMYDDDVEATINGVPIAAHIKALPQVRGSDD